MRITVFILFLALSIVFGISFFCSGISKTEFRSSHFDSPSEIVNRLKSTNQADLLSSLAAKHIDSYHSKISSLYSNMTVCLIMCVLAIVIVRRKKDIELPGFSTMQIPIQVSYLVIPAGLCYYWIQFGFLLHDVIGLRLELVKIVQAEYMARFHVINIDHVRFIDYYTYTSINSLKDTGFIDSWFLFFHPNFIPISQIGAGTKILPLCTMVLIGTLYGIGQGFAIGLPYNWIYRYQEVKKYWKTLCALLLAVISSLIIISHFTFYFGGKNYNWLQFAILLSTAISFLVITKREVRDHYKTVTE